MPNGIFDLSDLPPYEVEYVYIARRRMARRINYEPLDVLDHVDLTTYGVSTLPPEPVN
jgi:hypothetical protein